MHFNVQALILLGLFGISFGGHHPTYSPASSLPIDYFGAYGLSYGYGFPVPPPSPFPYSAYGPAHLSPISYSPQVVFNDPNEWKPIPGPLPAPVVVEKKEAVVLAEKPLDTPVAVEPVAPTHKSYADTSYYNSPSNIDIQPSLSYGYSYKLVPTYAFSPTHEQPASGSVPVAPAGPPPPPPPVLPPHAYYGLPPPHPSPIYGGPAPYTYGAPIPIPH